MRHEGSCQRLALPGLSDILARFGAPVAVVELPDIGATHRFGTTGIDGHLWSVEAETLWGLDACARASTFRHLGMRTEQTDAEALRVVALTSFVVNAGAAEVRGEQPEQPDQYQRSNGLSDIHAELDAAPRVSVNLVVAGEARSVSAVHFRAFTGIVTDLASNTVVAVLPTDQLADASLGVISTPRT